MDQKNILEQVRRFLGWSWKKTEIQFSEKDHLYFDEREVWWASLGENIGSETNGKNFHFERPVIIIKKFSKDMFFALPATTKEKQGSWYHPITIDNKKSCAVLSQGRTLSVKRLIRKMDTLSPENFSKLKHAFIALL